MASSDERASRAKLARVAMSLARNDWRADQKLSSFAVFLTSKNRITGAALSTPSTFVLRLPDDSSMVRLVEENALRLGALALVRVLVDEPRHVVTVLAETVGGVDAWRARIRGTGLGDFTAVPLAEVEPWVLSWTRTEDADGKGATISGVRARRRKVARSGKRAAGEE